VVVLTPASSVRRCTDAGRCRLPASAAATARGRSSGPVAPTAAGPKSSARAANFGEKGKVATGAPAIAAATAPW